MISEIMRHRGSAVFMALAGAAIIATIGAAPAPPAPQELDTAATSAASSDVSFAEDVLPLFQKKCAECHGKVDDKGVPWEEAGLNLLSYERVMAGSEFDKVIVPGDTENSYLFTQVVNGDMPQEGDPLTPEEIQLLKEWIEAGAPNN